MSTILIIIIRQLLMLCEIYFFLIILSFLSVLLQKKSFHQWIKGRRLNMNIKLCKITKHKDCHFLTTQSFYSIYYYSIHFFNSFHFHVYYQCFSKKGCTVLSLIVESPTIFNIIIIKCVLFFNNFIF